MKTYIITEEDITRLIESFNADSHKYWYEDKVDKWEESLEEVKYKSNSEPFYIEDAPYNWEETVKRFVVIELEDKL